MNLDPHNFILSHHDIAIARVFAETGPTKSDRLIMEAAATFWPAGSVIKDRVGVLAYLNALGSCARELQPDGHIKRAFQMLKNKLAVGEWSVIEGEFCRYIVVRNEHDIDWVFDVVPEGPIT